MILVIPIALDVKTIMGMVSISLFMQVIMLIFLCVFIKKYPGVKTFTAARIVALTSYSLIFTQTEPTSVIVALGSVLLVVSSSLVCVGIARFTNQTIHGKFLVAYNLIFISVQSYLVVFYNIFFIKTAAQSIFQVGLMSYAVYLLTHRSHKSFLVSSRFLTTVFLGMQLVLILRIIALIKNPPPNFFAPNEFNALSLIIVFVYTFLLTGGFIMMVCEKIFHDLKLVANTDELTQLLNRRAMMKLLEREREHPTFVKTG
jgi:predicted signal transduction protein with EAL and GGDEF domain